jgi:ribosome biogenesis GTPase
MSEPNAMLALLGWSDRRAAEFEPHARAGLAPGRVCLEHNHVYRVRGEGREWLAETSGRIKHHASGRHELPAVGDWVAIRPDEAHGRALIRAILTRQTWFSRRAAGRRTDEQVVAANIDTVLLVFGLDRPVNRRAIERYVVVARRSGAQPVVVLNKADLSEDIGADIAEATTAAGDAPVLAVTATAPDGAVPLEKWLSPGRTLAVLGPSGVGKSSIVNALLGSELLPTGEVRDWDARGRHTSVHRQLVVRAAGGLIVDTPGMRELQLWDTDEEVLASFTDVAELSAGCRFRDCLHDQEPGCAVKAAVESGALDAGRYESFLKLQGEQLTLEKDRGEREIIDAARAGRAGLLAAKRNAKAMSSAIKAIKAKQRDRER